MALKSYHRETLNDNWYEERSQPLNGVLPNDGAKGYTTTSKSDYNGAKPLAVKPKIRMVNARSIGPALLQSAGADIGQTFRSSLPKPNDEDHVRYLETTYRAAFGDPTKPSVSRGVPLLKEQSNSHIGGKTTIRPSGETFRANDEPQKDTASQRSWMYSMDPMLAIQNATRRSDPSVQQAENEAPQSLQRNHRRQITSITGVPFNHNGVFVDDNS